MVGPGWGAGARVLFGWHPTWQPGRPLYTCYNITHWVSKELFMVAARRTDALRPGQQPVPPIARGTGTLRKRDRPGRFIRIACWVAC